MNRWIASLVALLCVGAFASTAVLSQDRPQPSRVAFLDVAQVFKDYRKRTDIESLLNARTDALKTALKQRVALLEQKAEKLNTLNEGSDERYALEREIAIEKLVIKQDEEWEARRLERQRRKEEALLYKEICEEAGAMAQERGYGSVLLWLPLRPDFERMSELDLLMSTRTVLWRDESLDLTKDVVQRLNAALPPPPVKPPEQPKTGDKGN